LAHFTDAMRFHFLHPIALAPERIRRIEAPKMVAAIARALIIH
jgi:hypothetical protein